MEVLIINGKRHLINTSVTDFVQDKECERILKGYPQDAVVEWDENPTMEDVMPLTLTQILKNIKQ